MLILHRTEAGRTVVVPDDTLKASLAFAYPDALWLIDPDLRAVQGVPEHYWKVVGDLVLPMTSVEQVAADRLKLEALRKEALLCVERSEARRRTFEWEGDRFRLEIGPLMVQMLADEAGWDVTTCVSLEDGRFTEIPREQFRGFVETAFKHWQKWRERVMRTRDMIARCATLERMEDILDSLRGGGVL